MSLIFGGLLLFDTNNSAYEISVPIVIFTAALLGSFFVWVISKAVQARHREVHTGSEELIGAQRHRALAARPGRARVREGRAVARPRRATTGRSRSASEVVVERIDGLTLTVAPRRSARNQQPQRVE